MFHGSMVALVTPMFPSGEIDFPSLKKLVKWHLANHSDALVVNGTTGEVPTLTLDERVEIIECVQDIVENRIPIIAGTGTNNTETSIELTTSAMELGVDACLVVTPYYNRPSQEGLYQHFKAIAEATPVPQILYNVPSRTACDLLPETVVRLSKLSNIVGIKESTGDLSRVRYLKAHADNKMDIYSGDDNSACELILAGGRGVISVTANIVPQMMHEMCALALKGEANAARDINQRLSELHKLMGVEANPIPCKWALQVMNKIRKGIRLPLTPLAEQYHANLLSALETLNLIEER